MTRGAKLLVFAVIAVAFCIVTSPVLADVVIDTFDADLTVTAPASGTSFGSVGGGMIGGELDIDASSNGPGETTGESNFGSLGVYAHSQESLTTGGTTLVWDGPDGSAGVDFTGLGGEDLTVDGNDRLTIDIISADFPSDLIFTVWTDGSNASTLTKSLGAGPQTAEFEFADFATLLGGGADFANVGAISLFVDGNNVNSENLDMVIDFVSATGSNVPEPGSIAIWSLLALAGAGYALRRRVKQS